MGRLLGIVLFVLAVWFGARLATEGSLPGLPADEAAATARPTERAREAVERAQQESEERLRRLLPD